MGDTNKNIRWDIINDKCISTAFIQKFIPYTSSYHDSWETFVWHWNGKARTNLIGEYYHHSKRKAIWFHNRLLKIYSYLNTRKGRK